MRTAPTRVAPALLLLVGLFASPGQAEPMDQRYAALDIEPRREADGRWVFQLQPALALAQRQHKNIYLLLTAHDCGFCQRYERFLNANAQQLAPVLRQQHVLVVLRASLAAQGNAVQFEAYGKTWPYQAFQYLLGDERQRRLQYPVVWQLSPQLRLLQQLPYGTGTLETVADQVEIWSDIPAAAAPPLSTGSD
ncbi:thioredoxin family protein [Roseateles sp. BYS180W]|uniref:Thioredoxin family protein n=1 Tax=Roseateles rivi TaxID=3299028 RepID=A0ABW7FXB0_9BURK